jgi:HPt (histidine-containing phosphotransfer) domain-containing protein
MKLTKNKGMFFASIFVMLAVFNVEVFVIPFNKGGGFWSGYGFSMLAILLPAAVSFYAFDREGLKSKFYGVPLISVVWRYLVIQVIVGLIEMGLDFIPIPFQYGIALNTILLGACLIGLFTVEASKDEIERIDAQVKEKVFYLKSLQADVESLASRSSDDMKKMLKDLAETIRHSDPMSTPQLAAIENKIEAKATGLMEAVGNADASAIKALCNELQQLFAERNRKCKVLK